MNAFMNCEDFNGHKKLYTNDKFETVLSKVLVMVSQVVKNCSNKRLHFLHIFFFRSETWRERMMANTHVQSGSSLFPVNQCCPELQSLREPMCWGDRLRIFTEPFPNCIMSVHGPNWGFPIYGFYFLSVTRVVYFIFQSMAISLWMLLWWRCPSK